MENNKIILGYCPNFDRINDAEFLEGDHISNQLVKIYKDFIFNIDLSNAEEINQVREIDKIMGKYVDDYFFRKTMQEKLLTIRVKRSIADKIKAIVISIIELFKSLEEEQTRKIYISKWI